MASDWVSPAILNFLKAKLNLMQFETANEQKTKEIEESKSNSAR